MLKLSKKHIFLYRIHCELEERVQKGEEIPFNFECSNRFMETLKCPQGNGATESLTSISCVTRREKSMQQTTITSTHLSIIPNMKKPFVLIEREQTVVEQDADSDYVEDDDNVEDSADEHAEEEDPDHDNDDDKYDDDMIDNDYKKPTRRSTRANTPRSSSKSPPSPTGVVGDKRKVHNRKDASSPQGEQHECCLIGCTNTVTNRLRFSLRCHKHEDFKPSFLSAGWNKVCHYHYFSDLYKYKKNNGSSARGKNKKTTASAKKTTSGKRKREQDDENMDPQIQLDVEDEQPAAKRAKASTSSAVLQELSA